jgi:hypothetical protein
VSVGDRVTCGQRLGKVASSGSSTGPHLHFEPRYSDNSSDDPFSGPCGGPLSFWVVQGAYNDLPAEMCEGQMPPPPPPPDQGAIKGVVWDRSITLGSNDGGNVRIPGAIAAIEGGSTTTARDGDAFWSFRLPPGNYRVTVTANGYEPGSRDVTVTAGQDTWASVGLMPVMQPKPAVMGEADPTTWPLDQVAPAISAAEEESGDPPMVSDDGSGGGCVCLSSRSGRPDLWLLLILAVARGLQVGLVASRKSNARSQSVT